MNRIPTPTATFLRRLVLATVAVLSLALVGCAGNKESLIPIRAETPSDVDLSGRWAMRDDFDEMKNRIERAIRQTDGVDEKKLLSRLNKQARRDGRPGSSDVGGLVHVFLENASRLKITQTVDGLFISFNRAVVEEYRFGEARLIRTGGAAAQRVSGWDGNQYVIETLGEDGMKLTERYALLKAGELLTREIVLRSKDLEQISIVQSYGPDR